MKISVLIAAYQAGAYIGRALASVRGQSHDDWEVVVVEDGSRDATELMVNEFAASTTQSVRYLNLGSNQGVSAARNRLLYLATGDAVAFLDADDVWDPAHLQAMAAALRGGADVVVAGIRLFDLSTGATLGEYQPPTELAKDPIRTLFLRSAIFTSSCVALRRLLAQQVGHFDRTLRIGEDRDYWLRCALTGARFAVSPAITCFYAKHPGSTMARTLLVAEQDVQFYDKYLDLPVLPEKLRRHQLAQSLLNHGRLIRRHAARRSVACLWRAWRSAPLYPAIPCHLALSACCAALPRSH